MTVIIILPVLSASGSARFELLGPPLTQAKAKQHQGSVVVNLLSAGLAMGCYPESMLAQ